MLHSQLSDQKLRKSFLALATMGKLTSFLLLLSLYGQLADCCSSGGNGFLADAGAIASVGSLAVALWYPVDVYPSRCKRNHYQVCIFGFSLFCVTKVIANF